jgi:hypothetical protein
MRRWTGSIVLVLAAAAVGAAGCGGSSKTDSGAATTAKTTAAQTATQPAAPAKPAAAGSVDEAAQRLRQGGYTVSKLAVNPPAVAARKVGDHVLLYEYRDAGAAKKGANVIAAAVAGQPGRGLADIEARRVYFLGYTHKITTQERAAFADLVDVGEGRSSP